MKAPKILFLATEDWFVASHFRPLLARARADGFEVVIAARDSGAFQEREGYRVVAMPFVRRALTPSDIWHERRVVQKLLMAEQPDLIHAIALRPITLALLAPETDRTPMVMALTGRGYLEARGGWRRIALDAIARRMRAALGRGDVLLLTENEADQRWVDAGMALPRERMMLMPGAGVDPDVFLPTPEPPSPPIVVGIVARLVRSKGIDLAVSAVRRLRQEGMAIELRIAGEVDADNPDHASDAELASWRTTPGVRLVGRTADVNAFWACTHVACVPSRGGEGLPRSLLEAAACARPIITTNTPGGAEFVAANAGLIVPPNNSTAVAWALRQLAGDEAARRRMGAAARERVVAGFTESHAADCAAKAWRKLLTPASRR